MEETTVKAEQVDRMSISWHSLQVHGFQPILQAQGLFQRFRLFLNSSFCPRLSSTKVDILQCLDGLLEHGEMLMVLGKPGSGCTTFLKVIAGQTHGLQVNEASTINYQGVSAHDMHERFRGRCVYQAELDQHFTHLTVSETLQVAARAGSVREPSSESVHNIIKSLGLSGALPVKLGNDLVAGCSGGERKRTSIAEVLLSDSALQCWDNPTRGLDSGNAATFIKTIRHTSSAVRPIACVTLYQASEEIYQTFDKVLILYEGYQIFFGTTIIAKSYFEDLGFVCPPRVSTSDFLTSLTNPLNHNVRKKCEGKVPITATDFATIWMKSQERKTLLNAIQSYNARHPPLSRRSMSKQWLNSHFPPHARSSYRRSFLVQIQICLRRSLWRIRNDLAPPLSSIIGNVILSIILGSIFYDMPADTSSFFGRSVLIFFITLTNTFLGAFEGVQLWDHRPVVEKHKQYAFYRPSTEAIASMIADIPNKILLTAGFNIPFYFLANMRRTPKAFFIFYLFGFVNLLTGSMLFRTIGAVASDTASSIAPGATFILLLVIFTGFVLPIASMPGWIGWFRHINPVGYAFESLMINEFSGRNFLCSELIPQGPTYQTNSSEQRQCSVIGTINDSLIVDGDIYLQSTYQYQVNHLWRNLGIIFSIMVGLCTVYLLATEYHTSQRSRGEILTFKNETHTIPSSDEESQSNHPFQTPQLINKAPVMTSSSRFIQYSPGTAFMWTHLNCVVKSDNKEKHILKDCSGWVIPGSLVALMGASGAGKTTLLNILADRPSVGVVTGKKLVNQSHQNQGFGRKVGYAQQQDLHMATMTVYEALVFSARLRQPVRFSDDEKLRYVDYVIETLEMTSFMHAIIGAPGEGLNVEQRKRVTIAVELAARPELLLFLDEPTSGLDSITAWSICRLLRKLADDGQAILCTVHQPSAGLFSMFDRLLLLQQGQTIYFGDIGPNSESVIRYFEQHGARECGASENPAEWLLAIIADSEQWGATWASSNDNQVVQKQVQDLMIDLTSSSCQSVDLNAKEKFAASFKSQLLAVTKRNLLNDWRTPSCLSAKLLLTFGSAIFNGFCFYKSPLTLQGIQNQLFSVFLIFLLHSNLVQIILPHFLTNRALYECREGPSKIYSWTVFILSNAISEVPWQTLLAVVQYTAWYYPIGMYQNASVQDQLNQRSILVFLVIWSFLMFSSTFSHLLGVLAPDPATGINISALLWSLSLIFCGVLVKPIALPRFWMFMYRVSPATYLVNPIISTGLAGANITCAFNELVVLDPPRNLSCEAYLTPYMQAAGGRLLNGMDVSRCLFCPVAKTDDALAALNIFFSERWMHFGISLVFVAANILGALLLYRIFRVTKNEAPSLWSSETSSQGKKTAAA